MCLAIQTALHRELRLVATLKMNLEDAAGEHRALKVANSPQPLTLCAH
jgi:hypothetical protein